MKNLKINLKDLIMTVALIYAGAVSGIAQQAGQVEEMFDRGKETKDSDILSLVKNEENLSTFVELLEKSGLDKSLEHVGPVTILAPTNEAFGEMTKAKYKKLTKAKNSVELNKVLQAHIIPRKVFLNEFQGNQVLTSADGDDIPVVSSGTAAGGLNSVVIGGSTIIRPDIEASNGVIHLVDRVIIPGETGSPIGGPGVF